MWSPELETLDQLVADDMPLSVIRHVYPNETRFLAGMLGLLKAKEIQLWRGTEIGHWQWKTILTGPLAGISVRITDAGVARIG